MIRPISLLSLTLILSSCCLHRINLDDFKQFSLDRQIYVYEKASRDECIYSEKGALLNAISLHGYPSADVMVELLEHPRDSFPLGDAISVLEFVHFGGTDLRNHTALAALEHVKSTSPDSSAREEAELALKRIKSGDPLLGVKRNPG